MALHLKLQQALKLQQTLKLTPQLQLAMKMLQLNQLELSELLKQEMEKNPLLEVQAEEPTAPREEEEERIVPAEPGAATPGPGEAPAREIEPGTEQKTDYETDWNRYLEDTQDNFYEAPVAYHDPESESNLEEYVPSTTSLTEHLTVQLRLSDADATERKTAEYLIGLIDRNGYLRYEEAQVTETLGVPKETLDKSVALLQTFDPPGIGARNLTECLLLQYRALRDRDPFVETLIETYLQDLANNKIKQIARKEGVDLQTVLEGYEEIKRLDPKPGLHYGHEDKPDYVTPDVFVDKIKGELVVTLNEKYIPRLRVNNFYRGLLRAEKVAPKKTISYIKQKLNAARFLIDSIERRKDTIFNCTRRIFEIQDGFFDHGVKGLKPLTLKDVAEHVKLSESTISRVTTAKYVQTPRGLFQLKFFFSSGTTTSSGEAISSKHIREIIQELVGAENPRKPLSDAKIVKMLQDKGIDIARRTVAKYREELGIASSSKRRQFV